MTPQEILTAPNITLKPNPFLRDPDAVRLYQKRMILRVLSSPRFIIGDDVGLGKTREILFVATYIKAKRPDTKFLVLTEKIVFDDWMREIHRVTQGLTTRLITAQTHPDKTKRITAFRTHGADILITGYHSLYRYKQHIVTGLGPRWVLIADEPNIAKSTTSQIHSALHDLANHPILGAARTYGLTATIIENRLEEAFAILRILAPGTFESEIEFEKAHVTYTGHGKKRRVLRYRELDRFRQRLAPVFFGRLATDPVVQIELPETITKDLEIELPKDQSEKLREAEEQLFTGSDGKTRKVQLLPSMILAQQMADDPRTKGFSITGAKTEALSEFLQGTLAGQKVIVYSKLRTVIDQIDATLKQAGVRFGRITGTENDDQRSQARAAFERDLNVLLVTRAANKGANLQTARHLIMFDLPWSYGLYRQLVGRLKRVGSLHKSILVYHLLAKYHPDTARMIGTDRTIDHHTLATVTKKFKLWQAITDDTTEIESNDSDIEDIWKEMMGNRQIQQAV
jgi:SNF2 family DNA or RNA helicase